MKQQQFPTIDPRLLRPNPWNTNVVSPDNEAKLDESIDRFGMFKPIIVRELDNGSLEILGGAHRREAAIRKKIDAVPFMNLGRISDQRAKEISLVDNGRYGADDTLRLAELLDGLGAPDELTKFMPYTDADFASIFSSVSVALDELDMPDDEDDPTPARLPEKQVQTHQLMRFKVPVEDVARVTDVIEAIMKRQRFTEEDSLSNAGNALVHLCVNGA